MEYRGTVDFHHHEGPEPLGVLLTNVGTPDEPTPLALRRYLAQFLGDERVIEYPRWLWQPLLHGVILNTRPRRSARLYQRVWTEEGSPLLTILRRQAELLQAALATLPVPVRVTGGMRYGEPSIARGLCELADAGARRILVMPLFPQYSATTTATSLDAVFDELKTWRWMPELRTVNHYHDHPGYIDALANSVREYWAAHGRPDRLLMSFHGIPRDYFLKGDPYYCECQKTSRLLAAALGLGDGEWLATFQSRFGPSEWLQPYTSETITAWGREGLRRVDAICPGFSADCLETIDEVGHEGAVAFQEAGGGEWRYIPALNDRPDHIAALANIVARQLEGWLEPVERFAPPAATLARHRQQLGLDSGEAIPVAHSEQPAYDRAR